MASRILGRIRSDILSEINEIRPLTSKEYEKYKKAVSIVIDANQSLDLFKLVYYNFNDYEQALNQFFKQFVQNQGMDWNKMDGITLQLNRLISNYLSSIRLFLDHSEYALHQKYGKNSLQLKEFKKTCSNVYDNNFSYRFLSKLRNYVQHCGMPIGHININSKVVNVNPTKSNHQLELQFDRDSLLKNFEWKKLKPEIEKLPLKFDINSHIYTMNECVGTITFALIKNELPQCFKCSEYLKSLIFEAMDYGNAEGTPCILDVDKMTKSGGNVSIQWFPIHVIQWIDSFNPDKINNINVVYTSPDSNESTSISHNPTKKIFTETIEKTDRTHNLKKGINGTLYYIPEDYESCLKCNGPLGFYYKNELDIIGKRYTAEYFGCLKCKGVL